MIVPDRKRVKKEVVINDKKMISLFDTGSDLTVIQMSVFQKNKFGKMAKVNFAFDGIGATNQAIGYFNVKVIVDGEEFDDICFVIQDQEGLPELLIGLSLINQGELIVNANGLTMKKIEQNFTIQANDADLNSNEDGESSKFLSALAMCTPINETEAMYPETIHIQNKKVRDEVNDLVMNYTPKKTKKCPVELKIILTDDVPVYQRARRFSPKVKAAIEEQIKGWLKDGVIRPSTSDYASPVVPKMKKDGTIRTCIDYRLVNQKVIKDRFPLPVIEDQIDALEGAKVYSTLDLTNGYFHVPVAPESVKYTSFIVSGGQFEFLRAPFGLCTCPSVFSRFINVIFTDLIRDGTVIPYMDDINIPAQNEEEALEKLKRVLKVAEEYGLNIKWKKCKLLERKIDFLGYEIENGKIRASTTKTACVKNYSQPKNQKELQRFLGLTGTFRKFISEYATIARPLTDLMKENTAFIFGLKQQITFERLKELISERPVLALFKYGLETEVHTDACKYGLAAMLLQRSNEDNEMHPVRYWSRKTSDAEEKLCSYELEVLAVVEALRVWKIYLESDPFTVVTDCKAFVETMQKKEVSPKIARWAMFMQSFECKVVHRPGNRMKYVDALSRVNIIQVNGLLESIKKNQRSDDHIKAIATIIDERGEYEDYVINNELICRQMGDRKLIVVPEQMEFEIIRRAHDQGHFKSKKMEELILREFFIPKLKEKLDRFVQNCVTCILIDRKTGKKEGFLHPIPKDNLPLSTFHLDHLGIGTLSTTQKNYKHILVIVDAFSKFVWIFPVKSTKSDETTKKLQIVTAVFGNPYRVIVDKGTAFTGNEFTNHCNENGIEIVQTTTGVPRGNGQVERINSIIISVLAKLSIGSPEKWYQNTDRVQQCINKTYQRSIGMTPFQLLFGVKMKTKDDIEAQSLIEQEIIETFIDDREQLREQAKKQILVVAEENKRTFNAKRKQATKYEVGDLVAIKRTQFGTKLKLQAKSFGPYKITASKRNDRYQVKKIGIHEGPYCTSTSADHMTRWADGEDRTSIKE